MMQSQNYSLWHLESGEVEAGKWSGIFWAKCLLQVMNLPFLLAAW